MSCGSSCCADNSHAGVDTELKVDGDSDTTGLVASALSNVPKSSSSQSSAMCNKKIIVRLL